MQLQVHVNLKKKIMRNNFYLKKQNIISIFVEDWCVLVCRYTIVYLRK